MDSLSPLPSTAVAPASGAPPPPGALARLGRLLPGVGAFVRFAYRTAAASVLAAVLIVTSVVEWLAGASPMIGTVSWGAAAVGLIVLCIPAAATALVGWTLADLVRLPSQVRDAALTAAGRVQEARGRRLASTARALWAARGLALTSKGAWLRAVGAARFVRLASLPVALALLGLVSLNALVIAGGVLALLVLLF